MYYHLKLCILEIRLKKPTGDRNLLIEKEKEKEEEKKRIKREEWVFSSQSAISRMNPTLRI